MAMKVRIKVNAREVGRILKGEGPYQGVRDDLKRRMDRVEGRANAALPSGVSANRRSYVGHDRARETLGVPGGIEARTGVAARALDAAGGS